MLEIRTAYDRIYANILKTVRAYLNANPSLASLVVGISGGIDSALTCVLAHEVLADVKHVCLIGRRWHCCKPLCAAQIIDFENIICCIKV